MKTSTFVMIFVWSCFLVLVAIIYGIIFKVFTTDPTPQTPAFTLLSYTNEVKTLKYERIAGTGSVDVVTGSTTSLMMVCRMETTNAPAAILHVLTYGYGTTPVIRIYSMEPLFPPTNEWFQVSGLRYNSGTWIESVK